MTKKPSLKNLNKRRVELIGLEADSSESEAEDSIFAEPPSSTHGEEEEEEVESDDDDLSGSPHISKDGTIWTDRIPVTPFPDWRSKPINFGGGPKPQAKFRGNVGKKKSDYFGMMMTDRILTRICEWTNNYGKKKIDEWNKKNTGRKQVWEDITLVELKGFLGLLLLGGLDKHPKRPWKEQWSKDEKIRSPAFVACMSLKRFQMIMSCLQFHDSIQVPPDPAGKVDVLSPFREVFDEVTCTFSTLYQPAAKLCIDEQMVKFRGKCSFRMFMPKKPGKYGIKLWALVDNASGFILKLKVYEGAPRIVEQPSPCAEPSTSTLQSSSLVKPKRHARKPYEKHGSSSKTAKTTIKRKPEVGLAKNVVLELISEYNGSGRGVVADNFFSSLELVKELLSRQFTYCGTIRPNRREIPPLFKSKTYMRGQDAFLFNEDHLVTLVRHWTKKTKFALLISSAHFRADLVPADESGEKMIPEIVMYYNTNKGGVDTVDEMLSTYSSQFPSRRWTMKLFIHLLDCVCLNAFILWIQNDPTWMSSTTSRRRIFIRELAMEYILQAIRHRAATVPNLHKEIASAMQIMDVPYRSPEVPGPSAAQAFASTSHEGRCSFDSSWSREQKRSQRRCLLCSRYICKEHFRIICPSCFEAREQQDPTEAVQGEPMVEGNE